ncbi:hypothetical protein HK098_002475 [Nowakowskiella sp. JEL0407]|nr:hypothetical protein HK098_002475 [Nowakowskiella sp. JEL0407]
MGSGTSKVHQLQPNQPTQPADPLLIKPPITKTVVSHSNTLFTTSPTAFAAAAALNKASFGEDDDEGDNIKTKREMDRFGNKKLDPGLLGPDMRVDEEGEEQIVGNEKVTVLDGVKKRVAEKSNGSNRGGGRKDPLKPIQSTAIAAEQGTRFEEPQCKAQPKFDKDKFKKANKFNEVNENWSSRTTHHNKSHPQYNIEINTPYANDNDTEYNSESPFVPQNNNYDISSPKTTKLIGSVLNDDDEDFMTEILRETDFLVSERNKFGR